jgi:quercetin dioxygenase-like cupin family protein
MAIVKVHDHALTNREKLSKRNIFDSEPMVCDVYTLLTGQEQKPHRHDGQAKFYYVVEGEGEFTLDGSKEIHGSGTFVGVHSGVSHGVANRAAQPLVLLVGIAPNPNVEK